MKRTISKSQDNLNIGNNNGNKKYTNSPPNKTNKENENINDKQRSKNSIKSMETKNKKCVVLQCMHTKSMTSKNGLCSQHQATMERNAMANIDYIKKETSFQENSPDLFVRDINSGVDMDLCYGK